MRYLKGGAQSSPDYHFAETNEFVGVDWISWRQVCETSSMYVSRGCWPTFLLFVGPLFGIFVYAK